MNFNPNYMGYNFNQNMNPYMQSQQQNFLQQSSGLNGKIVESKDIVTVTEVPIGGYGIFPRADLSEIYVKTWDANSKQMNTLTYKLDTTPVLTLPQEDVNSKILTRIESLEQKFDNYFAAMPALTSTESSVSAESKKEVKKNAF